MEIIPVIDLQNGVVVRGVAGKRDSYRRIHSTLTDSCDPSVILKLFATDFGSRRCYIADLDAIRHQQLNRCTIAELTQGETRLLIDRGVRNENDVEELLDLGVAEVVVALETLPNVAFARTLVRQFGTDRLVLSIDLMSGRVLSDSPEFLNRPAEVVAAELLSVGFRKLIALDLAAVGMSDGTPTLDLCQQVRRRFPQMQIITGGGVRTLKDLAEISAAGVDAALVSSALHDGELTPTSLIEFATRR